MSNILKTLAAGSASEPTDEYFNQTTLLLHGDGTNGAQNNTFLDSSSNNFTITRNGSTTQGTFSPFSLADGEWSVYIGGVDDWVDVRDSGALLGSGAWTMEGWFYPTTTGVQRQLFDFRYPDGYSPDDNLAVIFSAANAVEYWNGSTRISGGTVVPNQWNHVLCSRDGSNDVRLFLNGVQIGSAYNDTTAYDSIVCRIGCANTGADFQGYVSNVRLVNGSAVQTSGFTVPTSPLTDISGTTFLGLQSNRFVDNSATPVTSVTPNDAVSIQPFSPFAPSAAYSPSVNGGSGYFDGTGDYLALTPDASLDFGAGEFTFEAWIYPATSTTTSNLTIIDTRPVSGSQDNFYYAFVNSSGKFRFFATAALEALESTTVIAPFQWTHVACARSGTTVRLFVNGVEEDSQTSSANLNSSAFHIGAKTFSSSTLVPWNGYLSDIRLEASALYTGNFSIPTAPPDPTGSELCLLMQNAGIFDNTGKNNLETVGNAQIDTATKKYGTGSMEFDGTGDVLTMKETGGIFTFGTGDYTYECWIYTTTGATTQKTIFGRANTGNVAVPYIYLVNSTGVLSLYYSATVVSSTTAIAQNTWTHIAVCRASGTSRLFINGVLDGSAADTTSLISPDILTIGGSGVAAANPFIGYIDDVRITKGVARYTSAFTPPTAALPDL